jgi:hypothetical protein
MNSQTRSLDHSSREALIRTLAEQMRQCETARRRHGEEAISTGYTALDRALAGGLERGTLVEWLASELGSGATRLALAAAREACGEGGRLVVIDRRRMFYPLAAAALGIDLSRLILVRPQNDRDETWAIDQALRSRGASAVLAWPEKFDDHLFRRLQLAAEAGGALGMFVRPARAIAEPSWAEVRWLVEPLPSVGSHSGTISQRIRLTLLRAPGCTVRKGCQLILNLRDGSAERAQSARRALRTQRRVRTVA